MKAIRVILITVIAIAAVVAYWRQHSPKTGEPASGDLVLQVRSVPITNHIALGSFVISPKSTRDVKIPIDESAMRNARVAGHFSTRGGSGVEVLLLDEEQFHKFQNHVAPSDVLYMSKAATGGDIEAKLPHGGAYFLVFDNSHSESSANVDADVTLRYETVRVDSHGDGKNQGK